MTADTMETTTTGSSSPGGTTPDGHNTLVTGNKVCARIAGTYTCLDCQAVTTGGLTAMTEHTLWSCPVTAPARIAPVRLPRNAAAAAEVPEATWDHPTRVRSGNRQESARLFVCR
eukprot:TRINITY_DN10406_c0_g1_i1.p1 TRINITY_DN10406_c0_g1~~TRINITY_DN10406_c0_g1_i1.p1  ORF type:complete len:133 (+),score=7.02 TRINITY_DN10406_c0_g1_i1:57-401(+)